MAAPDPPASDPDEPDAPSLEERVELLYDAFMDRALDAEQPLDPLAFVEAQGDLDPGARELLLERLEGIGRLTGLITPPVEATTPTSRTDEPERRIGEYRLVEALGGGAMGEVFLAEQSSLGRMVALKLQRSHLALSPTAAARFEREARALGQVNHPSVVRIHDYGQDGEVTFLAMELLPGRSLKERVDLPREGELPPSPAQVAQWGAQIARGLDAVHREGLVHRDVKPANLRIVEDPLGSGGEQAESRAVLVDFGLARLGEGSDLSTTGEFLGSPAYASPEQVRGAAELDGRSDVYSLGATLYQALAGRAPFVGDDLESVLHGVLSREPEPLSRLRPDLPRDLCLVVHHAMEKEPGRRYADAAALAADLEAVLELRPVSVKPLGPLGRGLRWTRRNRPLAAGLGVALVVALGSVAYVAESARRSRVARLDEAAGMLGEAADALEAFRSAREELAAEEAEFDQLERLQEYEHLGPERSRRLDHLEDRVRDARERRDQAFSRGENLLAQAERLDPDLAEEAGELGARLVLERLLEAQAHQDPEAQAFLAAELALRDPDGSLRAEAFPFARLTLTSDLPDTRAWVFRLEALDELPGAAEEAEGRDVPLLLGPDGGDLVTDFPLEPGREVLRVAAPPPVDAPLAEGDLITHLDDWPLAGGPFVRAVAPDSSLGEAAVQPGDRLVAVDGRPLLDPLDLEALLVDDPDGPHQLEFAGPPPSDRRVLLDAAALTANGVELEPLVERAERLGGWARGLVDGAPAELALPPGLTLRRSHAAPVLLAGATSPLGTPLALEPGRYLVVSRAPGRRVTRGFVLARPGAEHSLDATPTDTGSAPAGFVQVRVSDGRHAPYWIAEREVTAAEWLAFLNESAQQRTVDAALAEGVGTLYPRASGRVADSAMWHRSEDGTWLLPDTWSPDWPVLGISYLDAVAYAVWRTARDGRGTYRLPMAWQTVVAGTGDAVQRFSWGSRFDQRFSNSCFSRRVARPEPVLANPRDESVFGVYDTTGGALEWTPDWFDDTRDLRHAVGGSWAQARVDVLAVGGGQGFSEESCSGELGLRLMWLPPAAEGER